MTIIIISMDAYKINSTKSNNTLSNTNDKNSSDNQRLAALGDRVLGCCHHQTCKASMKRIHMRWNLSSPEYPL